MFGRLFCAMYNNYYFNVVIIYVVRRNISISYILQSRITINFRFKHNMRIYTYLIEFQAQIGLPLTGTKVL